MANVPTFDEYVSTLGRLTPHVAPTAPSPVGDLIRAAAESLAELDLVSIQSLAQWVQNNPKWVPALGLAVGLSQEKLKNTLQDRFSTSGWQTLARERPEELITALDEDYGLVEQVTAQRRETYDFGDILIARGGTRLTATRAGAAGRKIEDEIEAIATELELEHETRTRFRGRHGRTAPCDLVIPNSSNAAIAVAAKGFDSTGSKLTDAVREVEEMAEVRTPRQFILAVIDGIGWKSRKSDLRRIYELWSKQAIDGMYTLATLSDFRHDMEEAARMRQLL